jgi:two-component system response regulator AlgR
MRVLIVDDEPLARQRLARLLDQIGEHEVVAEAAHGEQAIDLWRQHQPPLVLMDIRMPGVDGLAAARVLSAETTPPAIIFCTAYNDYAVEAFDASAVGYLLKPVNRDKLQQAIAKAQQLNQAQLSALQSELAEDGPDARSHIAARSHQGIELIAVEEIRYFLAEQKYVTVVHGDGEVLIDDTLKELEQQFAQQFIRVHRNALVAVKHIRGLQKMAEGYRLKLADLEQGPLVSRRHLSEVRALLDKL